MVQSSTKLQSKCLLSWQHLAINSDLLFNNLFEPGKLILQYFSSKHNLQFLKPSDVLNTTHLKIDNVKLWVVSFYPVFLLSHFILEKYCIYIYIYIYIYMFTLKKTQQQSVTLR